jgi:hypothetical protein
MPSLDMQGGTMILDHPVIPLLGRLMMTYIFATTGLARSLDGPATWRT